MGGSRALEPGATVRGSLLEVLVVCVRERSLGLVSVVLLGGSVLASPSLKKSSERSGVGGS